MTNFQLKNTSDKAIKLTSVRKTEDDNTVKEDIALYPGDSREIAKLGGVHLDFATPVDISFRRKKAISEKLSFISRVVKEKQEKVTSVDLPAHFVLLKVKKVHLE